MTSDRRPDGGARADFEDLLRKRLASAGEAAPRLSPDAWRTAGTSGTQARASHGHNRWLPVAIAAVSVLVIVAVAGIWTAGRGGISTLGGRDTGHNSEASCAAGLSWRGRRYVPLAFIDAGQRVPKQGRQLGRAALCVDTNHAPKQSAAVYAIPGVPAGQGLWLEDQIYVRTDRTTLPRALADLDRPVTCTRPTTVTGRVDGVVGSPGKPIAYTLRLWVDHDLGALGMSRYAGVRVTVHVTRDTRTHGALQPSATPTGSGWTVRAHVVCRGDSFVATTLLR